MNLSRLTLLREVHFDVALGNLVSNPVPELNGLRTPAPLAHARRLRLSPATPVLVRGTGGELRATRSSSALLQ
jgi:hypothetical protein